MLRKYVLFLTCLSLTEFCMGEKPPLPRQAPLAEAARESFFTAANQGDVDTVIKQIQKYSDLLTAQDNAGNTALHIAVINRNVEFVESIMELSNAQNATSITNNAKQTPLDIANKLLSEASEEGAYVGSLQDIIVALGGSLSATASSSGDDDEEEEEEEESEEEEEESEEEEE